MAFLIPMRNLLSIKRNTFIKRFFSLLIAFLVMTISSSDIKSQDLLFGFTGGLNMNTISTKSDDGGLKVGFNLGGLAQYKLNEEMSLIANLKLSAKGQQYSKIIENQNDYLKIYHSTSLYYIDFPILFQYHIKDLLGLEIGPSFNFFLSGKDKSKIGNTTSDVRKFEKGSYNPFEFGLTFGIFTRDLGQSSFNNIFIEFRYFIGLTNVITDYGRNVNAGAFLNIGYIIENPLKK
ncbi:MAG: PorT family protein [Lentimicrobiaceae bacterium]|nr:PorT family protein [Lentimicrobiaceae bacterium]